MSTYIKRIILQGFKSFNKKISIPLIPGFNIVCGPNGSGKCVDGNTLVVLANGNLKTVKEIVENSLNASSKVEKLKDGFLTKENPLNCEVLSLNPITLKIEKQPVKAFVKRRAKKLFKIKTRTNEKIVTTGYHPFFIIKNGIMRPINTRNLKVGMKIAKSRVLPLKIEENKKIDLLSSIQLKDKIYVPYSEKIGKLLTILHQKFGNNRVTAEKLSIPMNVIKGIKGRQAVNIFYLNRMLSSIGIKLTSFVSMIKCKNSKVIMKVPKILNEELGRFLGYLVSEGSSLSSANQLRFVSGDQRLIDDFSKITSNLWGLNATTGNYKPKAVDVMIYSKLLQKLLKKFFSLKIGVKSEEKVAPEQIFSAPINVVSNFLSALIDGDGYIHAEISKGKHCCYLEYSTKSKKLAHSVVTLLLRLGIVSHINEKEKSATNTPKHVKQKYYSVMVYGIENLKKIKKLLPLRSRDKITKLNEISLWSIVPNPNVDLVPNLNNLFKNLVRILKINIKQIRKICPKLQAYYENRCECSRLGLKEVVQFVTKNYVLDEEAKKIIDMLNAFANSDIFWDEISGIEEIKNRNIWVYDLSVEGHHNFIANNIIVHNSNIIDAVCFVLGRTSAKSLRADRLYELIFHGSESKQPAQYASVTLYLDNSKKVFPLEDGEVSIQRKVNQKGICIYKINGRTTTREKVLEFLSMVRIHPDGYNIVLQGDVTQVIEMSPIERRIIIDEICGIAEYNEKKGKALKDLEAVDAKLKEAEIIINERYEIFRKLENDRNTALRYQNLQRELQLLKASLAFKTFSRLQENLRGIEEEAKRRDEENEKLREEIESTQIEIENCQEKNKEIIDELMKVSKRIDLERELSKLQAELLIKKDRIGFRKNEIERIDDLIKRLEVFEAIPRAVKSILNLKLSGVYGRVSDLIEIPEEYRVAIEVAGRGHLNDIITADENVASKCIDYLKKECIGIATFLPLNKIRRREFRDTQLLDRKGIVGVASELIKFDKKYENAIKFIFGDTLVVENLDVAKKIGIGKVRMVTLDGDLVERSGVMSGGYLTKKPKVLEQIERYLKLKEGIKKEIDILAKEVVDLEEKIKQHATSEERRSVVELEKVRIDVENRLKELNGRRNFAYEKRMKVQSELNKLNIQRAKLEAELESAKIDVEQYGQVEYIDEKISVLKERIQTAFNELNSLGPVNFKAIEEYEKFRGEFEGYRSKYEKILEEKKAVLDMIDKIEEKRREVFYACLNEVKKYFSEVFMEIAKGEATL
ncbi:MAG: LAGLIDADG family homing endonuclease, partial [Candidatus Aenigmarchaeota archaeon]|nr:LAGLIDADG family homing endonuclease [Candidatus Aenigmarchaeota archaeon]